MGRRSKITAVVRGRLSRGLVAGVLVALGLLALGSAAYAAGGPLYLVYVNLDAFGYDLYEQANRPPYAGTPHLNGLLSEGVLFTNATTGIPSLTAPMQTTLVTGAWPAVHGNYYRGYDKEANLLRQTGREDEMPTLAELFTQDGLSTASVQQFTLLDKGAFWDNPDHLYLEPGGGFAERAKLAAELVEGLPVHSLHEAPALSGPPRFLALYADDLDVLGHNEHAAFGLPVARDEAGRLERVLSYLTGGYQASRGLPGLDESLGQFLRALRDQGLYDQTVFALAADHGMTGLSGQSSLPDLVATVAGLGHRVQFLRPGQNALPDTQVALWSAGLQVHFAFREEPPEEEYQRLVATLAAQNYYGGHFDRAELARRGAHPASGDLIVWPKPPHHFKTDVTHAYLARGQHDTGDPSSQRIFLALAGPGVRKGVRSDTPVWAVDLAPTLAHLFGFPPLPGAQGRVLEEALENPNGEENGDVPAQSVGGR